MNEQPVRLAQESLEPLPATAYVLRWPARGTAFERAPVPRLRDSLLKIAAWMKAAARRVVLHLTQGASAQAEWLTIPRRLGGVGPSVAGV